MFKDEALNQNGQDLVDVKLQGLDTSTDAKNLLMQQMLEREQDKPIAVGLPLRSMVCQMV